MFLEYPPNNPSHTNAGSTQASMLYIEKIAQFANISYKIIRKISNWTNSVIMPTTNFNNHIKDIYHYCASPYFVATSLFPMTNLKGNNSFWPCQRIIDPLLDKHPSKLLTPGRNCSTSLAPIITLMWSVSVTAPSRRATTTL